MKGLTKITLSLLLVAIFLAFFFLPIKEVLIYTETEGNFPKQYYYPLEKERRFDIRYVHSIHLTDVIERYEVTQDLTFRLLSMSYENLAIGMPASAGEGETLELKDGVYTLHHSDRELDSFRIHIGRVDEDLALRYKGIEIDLKEYLEKGKSYTFEAKKIPYYTLWKGERLNGER